MSVNTEQKISGFNLPNCLTVLRLLLVPLILAFILSRGVAWQFLGTALFILAAVTDHFDGRIARRRRQVTQFGKFADPLVDKILTLSVFLALAFRPEFADIAGYLALWISIIAVREIGITFLRIWAIARGTPVITSLWGKAKTTAQLITIITTLALLNFKQLTLTVPSISFYPGDQFLVYIVHALVFGCMLLTVISGILYLVANRFEPRKAGQFP